METCTKSTEEPLKIKPQHEESGLIILDYSQVEVAADARHRVRSCGPSPRVPCNEADTVRSACLNGKKMAIKMKVKTDKNIPVVFSYIKHVYP